MRPETGRSGPAKAGLTRLVLRAFLLGGLLCCLVQAGVATECRPALVSDRQRYGFVVVSGQWPEQYDTALLNAGWYVDYTQPIYRTGPAGMDRALGLRTPYDLVIEPSRLGPLVDNHPGTIWLIGNEPDCIWQDDLLPEEYAHLYHSLYVFIKGRDPAAQVAAGGIVQPTPARLAWLDRVLAEYQRAYGEPMPVDLWQIHNMILNETPGSWGCGIPPGIDPALGVVRAIDQNDSMAIFTQQLWDFRQWMANHGYGGTPLIVSEYGVLMSVYHGLTPDRVRAFMSNTFSYMATTTDLALGDPMDGYRLVQRWAWYSLDDQPWVPPSGPGYNGNLFDPSTKEITVFGQHFASHTGGLPPVSHADLTPGRLEATLAPALPGPGGTATLALKVEVKNGGTAGAGSFKVTVDGLGSGPLEQVVSSLSAESSQSVSFAVADLPVGAYSITGKVDAFDQVVESTECNNEFDQIMVVPAYRYGLPLIARRAEGVSGFLGQTKVIPQAGSAATAGTQAAAFQAATTSREWIVPTAGSQPTQTAISPIDGMVWFSEWQGNRIVRFDPATETFAEYTIPTAGSKPGGVAIDGAGRVWFAETAGNKIGRLDPQSGTFTEYAVPTANSKPWDVTVDSAGAIWFTERASDKIGRVSTAGVVTEYNVQAPQAPDYCPQPRPTGLVFSGSYVWFTAPGCNKLGRIRTTGTLPAYTPPIETPDSLPQDVTLDVGGNPWLTEMGGNKIAIFFAQTSVSFSEFAVPTAGSQPFGIAMAPDGRTIWFTERAGNKIGRLDLDSGLVFPESQLLAPGGAPTGIAVDGAGCAWYTAPGTNRIGRLCLALTTHFLPVILKNW